MEGDKFFRAIESKDIYVLDLPLEAICYGIGCKYLIIRQPVVLGIQMVRWRRLVG
jgi:hypothetical protein